MSATPFVHLHNHTDYSLLDGACEIGRMMDLAAKNEWPAIAITDHGNLFGAYQFYSEAKSRGIKPIIGCELYVTQDSHTVKTDANKYYHLVVLCKNEIGYRNLMELVSTAYLDGFYYKPRIDKSKLAQHAEGLICLSACLAGDLNDALIEKGYDEGKKLAYEYVDIFGKDNFFIEIQDHGLDLDKKLIPQLWRLSSEIGIPLVATNDAHYLTKDDYGAHDALLCVQTGKTIADPNRMRFERNEFYLKSRDEMLALFDGDAAPLDRTWEIAQQCDLRIDPVKNPFPQFDVPEKHDIHTYFEFVARQGFEKRRARWEFLRDRGDLRADIEEYAERLDREIGIIQQMKYSGYFLIVWDFIRYARQNKIPVGPGRGSAAGSLVAYCMEITDVDPLQYGLLFERFLNPERVSMPDIDIDFCMHRRGEVIQYVNEKYGREQVAQIITFNTMAAKAAVKDIGRVMDMSFGDVDRFTKLFPNVLNIKLDEAVEQEPQLKAAFQKDADSKKLLEHARRVEGFARNSSVHAAGVVIAPEPLRHLVPLYKSPKDDMVVTQYDMKCLDKLGLLKMDFLGLTTLTVIEDALENLKRHKQIELIPNELPLEDPETYALLSKGLTSGVFQFESEGMRDILRRYQPERLEDLCALNALYRPGPIKGGMVTDFIERKHGRKPVTYIFAELEPLLNETYGVILYQEQVMQIANVIAGYSLGEADLLRRAMGKKKVEEMEKQRVRFLEGAAAKGFDKRKTEKLYELMAQFAGYGFNKSHSAAYGFVAFVTAYLKAHFPVYFMAALLSSETNNTDKVVKYINECKDMSIRILPPDLNESYWAFTPAGDDAIRFGLGAIKNVGAGAVEAIVKARQDEGGFKSIHHFCETVEAKQLNKRVLESSIKAGAMDSFGGQRSQLTAAIDGAMERGQKAARDRETGQGGLFAAFEPEPGDVKIPLPDVPAWTEQQKLAGEKEMLGFYVTGHPLEAYEDKVSELATHSSANLDQAAHNEQVALCGVLSGIQRKRNREQKPWAAAQLEDLQGVVPLLVFANAYEDLATMLVDDQPSLIRGSVRVEEGAAPKVSVSEIVPLDLARVNLPKMLAITVRLGANGDDNGKIESLQKLCAAQPGETDVRLRLMRPKDFLVFYDLPSGVRADKTFRGHVEALCGEGSVETRA